MSGHTEREFPQSLDAERGVLASILLAPEDVLDLCAQKDVTRRTFYLPAHDQIFAALCEIREAGKPVDFITLAQHLNDAGQLETVGGPSYLNELFILLPSAANVSFYLDDLLAKKVRRGIIEVCSRATEAAYAPHSNQETGRLLDDTERKLAEIVRPAKKSGLPLMGLRQILDYTPDPTEEIWLGGILSAGMPTGLIGAPGVGKSRLALQACIHTILGWKFLGWPTRGQGLKWLFLQTENSTRRLKYDLAAMTSQFTDEQRTEIDAGLRVLNVSEMDFATICMADGHPDKGLILSTLDAWPADVVVIDPLRDAGRGDLNKDMEMTETCQGIGAVVRRSNPCRAPFIIHHGRTGASEASKVFGDDAASFGRNSKVLNGWLRSQINVAPAGVEYPDTVIVGCGKNSNGPKWEPFAAQLQPDTMTYRRLEPCEFDLAQWAEGMAGGKRSKAKVPTPFQVAEVIEKAGGEVVGGVNKDDGLVKRLQRASGANRNDAICAIEAAVGVTILAMDEPRTSHRGGGSAVRKYILKA